MLFLKKGFHTVCSLILSAGLFFFASMPVGAVSSALPEAVSYTESQLVERTEQTYTDAKKAVGYRSFNGRCSSMVNGSVIALGLHDATNRGNGRDIYDRYKDLGRTSTGYDVVCYDGSEYDLAGALRAVSGDGSRDVYNLIVGWDSGITASAAAYGHACFVHGIVDGMVYFSESFALELLNGDFYWEGEPIVCSIDDFAAFYNKWAYFEGLIHFDYPDETAPDITVPEVRTRSAEGFTVSFRAEDDMEITELYVRVWRQGETEEAGVILPVTVYDGAAAVRVNSGDFDDYRGAYYVKCYALDRKGNLGQSEIKTVTLYRAELEEGCVGTAGNPLPCVAPARTPGEGTPCVARYGTQEPTLWETVLEQLNLLLK